MVAVKKLLPYARNAKKHNAEQVQAIAASIREFGFCNPVLIDKKNGIVAGHGRVLAATQAGLAEVPCIRLGHLTENQRRAYILADNRLAETGGGWDLDLLRAEVGEIDFDELKAFTLEDLDLGDLLREEEVGSSDAEPQVDRAEELNQTWGVKPGDLWLVGEHRLLCGDSTKADDVGRVLGDARPVLMVTDPPYGVEYDANWRNEADRANGKPYGARAVGKVTNDDRADWTEAWKLFSGDVAYVYHADVRSHEVAVSLIASGFGVRALIVWAKSNFAIGRGHYHHKHEPCWYVVREGKTGHWIGDHSQTTLWEIEKPQKSETGHSTQKPIECMARPMRNHDAPEVYDPFLGSGTTMVAAQNLSRKCFGLEISPAYCAVILQRMAAAFPGIEIRKAKA